MRTKVHPALGKTSLMSLSDDFLNVVTKLPLFQSRHLVTTFFPGINLTDSYFESDLFLKVVT